MKTRKWNQRGAIVAASLVCLLLAQVQGYSYTVRGFWYYDDVSGTTVPDHSNATNNPGTLVNGATTSTDTPFTSYPGNLSMSLDGTNDRMDITIGDLSNLVGSATIETWVKPSSLGAENWVARFQSGVGSEYYAIRLVSGTVQAFFGSEGGTASSPSPISAGVWTHLAVTFDFPDNKITLFTNGIEAATATLLTGGNTLDNTGIGAAWLGTELLTQNFYAGLMDEVRIGSGVLPASQIQLDFSRTLVPEPSVAALGVFGLLTLWMRRRQG